MSTSGMPRGRLVTNATFDFSVYFEDADGAAGNTIFTVSDFSGGPVTLSVAGVFSVIDETRVVAWGVTTENQFGDANFAFTFDELSMTLAAVPVPEPSTYAVLAGALGLAAVLTRRRRR